VEILPQAKCRATQALPALKSVRDSPARDTNNLPCAAFIHFRSGTVTYHCFHNRCAGVGWRDVKHLLDLPTYPGEFEPTHPTQGSQ